MLIKLATVLLLSLALSPAWAATCTSSGTGNWNTSGRWDCGHVPSASDDAVIGNGSSMTVTAMPATAVNSLAVSGTSSNTTLTVNAGVALTITGDVSINAPTSSSRTNLITLNAAGAALSVGGNLNINGGTTSTRVARLSIGNSSSNRIDVNGDINFSGTVAAAQLTFSGAGALNVAGNFGSGGTLTDGSGTITYDGNGAQSVGAYTYNALVIANSGATATAAGNIAAASVTINGGSALSVPGSDTLTLSGSFANSGTYTGGTGAVSIQGNFSDSGTFASGSGTWIFNGSSAQTITGNASGTTAFSNLAVNNASGITLAGNVTVGSAMTFTAGDIATGSNLLALPCASTTTANANSYVNGNVRLTFPAGATTCVFPVGDSSVYAPITVTTHGGSGGGTLTGSTTAGQAPSFWSSNIDATQSVYRYWSLGQMSGDTFISFPAGASYDVQLQFASSDIVGGSGSVGSYKVGVYNYSWSTLAGSASGTMATLTGQNAFGYYAVGKPLSACVPPSNIPAGVSVTCVCDNFNRTTLNPSPIFGGNWAVSSSGARSFTPGIDSYTSSGNTTYYLRLTDANTTEATAVTVPGIYPAAGNYISVEFKHYAYHNSGGSDADGIAVTLSDYSVPAVPGAFGGSLGYAQKSNPGSDCTTAGGCPGFAGGWLGVALDEYGNYSNPTEGRIQGPGFSAQSVGARGPGSGQNGYRWIGGSLAVGGVSNGSASTSSPQPGSQYQIVVDARNSSGGSIPVYVRRDSTTKDGTHYQDLLNGASGYNAYTEAAYALSQGWTTSLLPTNWQISFTGSTGASTNIHEIAAIKVCAQNVFAPTAGSYASPFTAIDEAYGLTGSGRQAQLGHIYTKVAGKPFRLGITAFSDPASATIDTTYGSPTSQNVTVQLIDDSSGATSCKASSSACTSCTKPQIGSSQTVTFTGNGTGKTNGQAMTNIFTVNSAFSRVIARMCSSSSCGCSTNFAIRPDSLTLSAASGTFKAGTDAVALSAAASASNYTGSPQINTGAIQANGGLGVVGIFTPAAFPAALASTASGTFTYSEVGTLTFLGYDPAVDATSVRGIDDPTWGTAAGDCVVGSYSNMLVTDTSSPDYGKYGCNFGITASTTIGRFIPDHFYLSASSITPAVTGGSPNFTYMTNTTPPTGSSKLGISYTLQSCAGAVNPPNYCPSVTTNYDSLRGYTVYNPVLGAEDLASGNQGYDLSSRISLGTATPAWSAGQYAVTAPASSFSLPTSTPGGPPSAGVATAGGAFDMLAIGVRMSDPDASIYGLDMNATAPGTCSGTGCDAKQIGGGTTSVRQGRMALINAYGSELLTLPVKVQAQYYNYNSATNTGTWLPNGADTGTGATAIPAGAAVISNPKGKNGGAAPIVCFAGVGSCSATAGQISPSAVTLVNGAGTFKLTSNGVQGTADLALNLGTSGTADNSCNGANPSTSTAGALVWLRYAWCTKNPSAPPYDPNARVQFGTSKSAYIFLRELY